jgi:hypothetical protein
VGTAWFDYDNDGWLDMFSANGRSSRWKVTRRSFPYDQHRLLFRNLGNGRFEDVTGRAGASFTMSESGRGAAFGDIDNDGDIDILVGNDAGRARLLVNNIGNRQHWAGLRLAGGPGPRDMLGARVGLGRADAARYGAGCGRTEVTPRQTTRACVWPRHICNGLPGDREVAWRPIGRLLQCSVDAWTTLRQGEGK